jgi:hypothetical protein
MMMKLIAMMLIARNLQIMNMSSSEAGHPAIRDDAFLGSIHSFPKYWAQTKMLAMAFYLQEDEYRPAIGQD